MHNRISLCAAMVLAALLGSCVSMEDRVMTPQEEAEAMIIGRVMADFTSQQILHIRNKNRIKKRAYNELMKVAQFQYQGNIDVRNIKIQGGPSGWLVFNILSHMMYGAGLIFGNTQEITVTGDVVLLDGAVTIRRE